MLQSVIDDRKSPFYQSIPEGTSPALNIFIPPSQFLSLFYSMRQDYDFSFFRSDRNEEQRVRCAQHDQIIGIISFISKILLIFLSKFAILNFLGDLAAECEHAYTIAAKLYPKSSSIHLLFSMFYFYFGEKRHLSSALSSLLRVEKCEADIDEKYVMSSCLLSTCITAVFFYVSIIAFIPFQIRCFSLQKGQQTNVGLLC